LNGRNQIVSDGLLLMIVGGLGVYLRSLPLALWEWLSNQSTLTMTVTDDDEAFVWVNEWFLEQNFARKIRRVDIDTTLRRERPALLPAEGKHWFWFRGRPFCVQLYRSQETRRWSRRQYEQLTLRTFGRSQEFLKQFVDEVVASHARIVAAKSSLYIR